MAELDIFNRPEFAPATQTAIVQEIPYRDQFLGSLGLFGTPDRLTSEVIGFSRTQKQIGLITTTPRGAPPAIRDEARNVQRVYLGTPRLAVRQIIQASAIQSAIQFGTQRGGGDAILESVQDVITRANVGMRQDMEDTWELHRLGALFGKLMDADGVTVLADFFQTFGYAEPAVIDFELDDVTKDPYDKTTIVHRYFDDNGDNVVLPGTQVLALCGHGFYDKLRRHPKVLETFKYIVNGGEAMQRNEIRRSFDWADIRWYDWKQTRNSPLAVGENEVRFVLRNANGMFGVAFAPGESLDTVNQPGQDVYSIIVRDTERNFWVQPELYSYPLHYCRRPDLLLRGIAF